jgi:hypothetical protein
LGQKPNRSGTGPRSRQLQEKAGGVTPIGLFSFGNETAHDQLVFRLMHDRRFVGAVVLLVLFVLFVLFV